MVLVLVQCEWTISSVQYQAITNYELGILYISRFLAYREFVERKKGTDEELGSVKILPPLQDFPDGMQDH